MNRIISIAIVLAGIATISAAEAKGTKLVTCEAWIVYKPAQADIKSAPLYVCFDNEDKPFIMHDVQIVERKVDGDVHRVAVGTK